MLAIDEGGSLLGGGEEVLLAPLAKGDESWEQIFALFCEYVLGEEAAVGGWDCLHDAGSDEVLEAGGEDVFGESETALEVGEAADAEHGVADNEERPPFADDVERAGHGTDVVIEGLAAHDGCSRLSASFLKLVASLYQLASSYRWLQYETRFRRRMYAIYR
jgi:hypothetical protein